MSDVTPPPAAAPYAAAPTGPKTNTLAIVSLVTGIVGLFIPIGLAAVITGHIALGQIKRLGENGRGMAITGLVLGYLSIVLALILAIVWVSFFAIVASNPGGFAP
jgi:1,4-dihydroxy-2-naphthoate octaprenyltransferase